MNGRLKLAALALALLLWISVSAEEPASQWLVVPVEVALLDPMQTLVRGPVPHQVEILFAGTGRDLWELAINRPSMLLPVRDPEDDDQIFVLDPEMVRIPQGLDVAARDVRPSSVRLVLKRLVAHEVPVRVRLPDELPDSLVWIERPRARPGRVELVGPREQVETVDTLFTRPLVVERADSALERTLALDTTGLAGVRLSASRVRVTGRVDRVVSRTLPAVPVVAPPGTRAEPASVEVRVSGAESRVQGLRSAGVRVLPASGSVPEIIPAAGASVPLRVDGIPSGLSAVAPRAVRLRRLPPPPDTLRPDTLMADTIARDGVREEDPR